MSDFITNAELRIEAERLCGENERLETENAKLREENERLLSVVSDGADNARELRAENAKLRKLSSIMLKCIMANERRLSVCWECPVHKQFDELRSYCCLEHEAKELGIEVGA